MIPTDTVLTNALANIMVELSWAKFAIIAMDDVYGRRFAQGLISQANLLEKEVETYEQYRLGNAADISRAVKNVKDSGVRIIVALAFTSDIEKIAVAANQEGIGGRGYVWITGDLSTENLAAVIAGGSDPNLASYLTGWLSVSMAAFTDPGAAQFQSTFQAEPLESFENQLFPVTAAHTQACSDVCGYMYDAVFGAALALSASFDSASGTVDPALLNTNVRSLDFSGATGTVRLLNGMHGPLLSYAVPTRCSVLTGALLLPCVILA